MVKYITLEEAIDILDLSSDAKEQVVRTELEKYNFQNNTQYILD